MDRAAEWILTSWHDALMAIVSVAVVYTVIIAYCRLVGVRSFAKMSAFDFAMTVAVGSLFGTSVASQNPPLLLAIIALGALFLGQWLIGIARRRLPHVKRLVDNEPLLLVHNGEIILPNLRRAQITMDDLRAKLREANVLELRHVHAVVAETSGNISIMHSAEPSATVSPVLLEGVRGGDPRSAESRSPSLDNKIDEGVHS
jgi:uncharacterized membrane protein YcaP (DUF421 family)